MNAFKTAIKNIFKCFFYAYSTPDPIKTDEDVANAKKWLKKTVILYGVFTAVALVTTLLAIVLVSAILENEAVDIPTAVIPFIAVLALPLTLLTCWGYASFFLYFKKMIKVVFNASKFGFIVGEQVKTTYVDVTHEYGNTYKVSSHTETKGLLFAYIAATASFVCWAAFCVYVAPFLTFKKVKGTLKNIDEYKIKVLVEKAEAAENTENREIAESSEIAEN